MKGACFIVLSEITDMLAGFRFGALFWARVPAVLVWMMCNG